MISYLLVVQWQLSWSMLQLQLSILTLAGVLMTRRVATVDDYPRLDVRNMKRRGKLEPGASGTLSWACHGRLVDRIRYESHSDRLVLVRHSERQTIRFETTPCQYGGRRKWFLCPSCCRRVAVLCGVGGSFFCRHCHQLRYLSQSQSRLRRLIGRKQHIANHIFEGGDTRRRFKRKGLHGKTLARGLERFFEIEQQISGMCSVRLERRRAAVRMR